MDDDDAIDEPEECMNWFDEDPTGSPERIDSEYQHMKDDDDSAKK